MQHFIFHLVTLKFLVTLLKAVELHVLRLPTIFVPPVHKVQCGYHECFMSPCLVSVVLKSRKWLYHYLFNFWRSFLTWRNWSECFTSTCTFIWSRVHAARPHSFNFQNNRLLAKDSEDGWTPTFQNASAKAVKVKIKHVCLVIEVLI